MYITDAVKSIMQSTAGAFGGPYFEVRWWDITHPPKEETRTEEDIKAQVFGRLAELREGGG